MRTCRTCSAPLTRKDAESPGRFAARIYCDRKCSGRNRERRRTRLPLGACERCGVQFRAGLHDRPHSYWVNRRFCSQYCANALPEWPWTYDPETGCCPWTASPPYADGYARIKHADGSREVVHRYVYGLLVRVLAPDEILHHDCPVVRTKICVNPEHMLVTNRSDHQSLHLAERRPLLPDHVCEWCGTTYRPTYITSQNEWAKRRFCCNSCCTRYKHAHGLMSRPMAKTEACR